MIQNKVLLLTQTCLKIVMFSLGLQYFSKFVSSLIFHAVDRVCIPNTVIDSCQNQYNSYS